MMLEELLFQKFGAINVLDEDFSLDQLKKKIAEESPDESEDDGPSKLTIKVEVDN